MPTKKENIIERIKEGVIDAKDYGAQKLGAAKDKTEDVIKEHPFISVAVAAAVGAAVALGVEMLFRERKRSFFDRVFG